MTGRPSKYKPEFAEQAAKLCALGATDAQLADFFEVDIGEIALWAWCNEQFYRSITPTQSQIDAYNKKFSDQRAKRKRNKSPAARLINSMRARLWAALKGRSDGALFSRLGYTREELMLHLESRFRDGMTWENYGAWHVDHIKPCAMFDQQDMEEFGKCWALNNLQPLWATENVKKGASYAGT